MPMPSLTVWVASGVVSAMVDVTTQYIENVTDCDHRKPAAIARLMPFGKSRALVRKAAGRPAITAGDAEEEGAPPPAGALVEYCDCPGFDRGRMLRYGLVHVFYSTPLHILRLMALNALVPGPASVAIAVAKTAINELLFSPGDTAMTLALVELGNSGSRQSVVEKIRTDFVPYQLSKWTTHTFCQLVVFTCSSTFESQMYIGLGLKLFAEIILDHLANRNKSAAARAAREAGKPAEGPVPLA